MPVTYKCDKCGVEKSWGKMTWEMRQWRFMSAEASAKCYKCFLCPDCYAKVTVKCDQAIRQFMGLPESGEGNEQ